MINKSPIPSICIYIYIYTIILQMYMCIYICMYLCILDVISNVINCECIIQSASRRPPGQKGLQAFLDIAERHPTHFWIALSARQTRCPNLHFVLEVFKSSTSRSTFRTIPCTLEFVLTSSSVPGDTLGAPCFFVAEESLEHQRCSRAVQEAPPRI